MKHAGVGIVVAGVLGACSSTGSAPAPVRDDDAGVVVTRSDASADDAGFGDGDGDDAGDASSDPSACVGPTWAATYGQGTTSVTSLSGLAADGQGGVYLAGLFTGDVDFGGGALHAAALGSSFVAKVDAAGHVVWARSFGGTGETQALGIGAAPDGSRVVVTGTFTASLSIAGDEAGTMTAPDEDVFVAAFDGATGAPAWATRFGGPGLDRGLGAVVAADGSVAVSGVFAKSIDFGDGAHATNATNGAAYVAKLGPGGAGAWSRAYEGIVVGANAIAVDATGDVLFTAFGSDVDLGGGTIAAAGGKDVIVAKLDGAGNHVYSASFGGLGDEYGYGAAVTADGSLVVTGGFEGPLAFGGAVLEPKGGGPDVFVAEVDAEGKVQWAIHGTEGAFGVSVALAKDGLAFVLEDQKSNPNATPRSGATLRAIAADGTGARVAFTLTGALDSIAESTVALPSGDVLVGGSFSGSVAICGADALVAAAAEVRSYVVDLDAKRLR